MTDTAREPAVVRIQDRSRKVIEERCADQPGDMRPPLAPVEARSAEHPGAAPGSAGGKINAGVG